jgi:hypothetical protein
MSYHMYKTLIIRYGELISSHDNTYTFTYINQSWYLASEINFHYTIKTITCDMKSIMHNHFLVNHGKKKNLQYSMKKIRHMSLSSGMVAFIYWEEASITWKTWLHLKLWQDTIFQFSFFSSHQQWHCQHHIFLPLLYSFTFMWSW